MENVYGLTPREKPQKAFIIIQTSCVRSMNSLIENDVDFGGMTTAVGMDSVITRRGGQTSARGHILLHACKMRRSLHG